MGGHLLILKLKIDDPLDAFAVHGCGGFCGVLTRPLFDRTGAQGTMFGAHCLAAICIIAWVSTISLIVFGLLSKVGLLQINEDEQKQGTDERELAQSQCYRATSKAVGGVADPAAVTRAMRKRNFHKCCSLVEFWHGKLCLYCLFWI